MLTGPYRRASRSQLLCFFLTIACWGELGDGVNQIGPLRSWAIKIIRLRFSKCNKIARSKILIARVYVVVHFRSHFSRSHFRNQSFLGFPNFDRKFFLHLNSFVQGIHLETTCKCNFPTELQSRSGLNDLHSHTLLTPTFGCVMLELLESWGHPGVKKLGQIQIRIGSKIERFFMGLV